MRKIDHLIVVAGPTASGKSLLLSELRARRLPLLQEQIGVGDLQDWPQITTGTLLRQTDLDLDHVILQYDFLWPYPSSIMDGVEWRALSVLEGARQISIFTLWTPPARLAGQLIDGRIRGPVNRNTPDHRPARPTAAEALRMKAFRLMPRAAILGLTKFPWLNQVNHRLPNNALVHHLVALRIYSDAERAIAMYRRWFEFCDRRIANVREHVIVELETTLKFYSRDEWETGICLSAGPETRNEGRTHD
jgi:hypothetical protein